VTSPEYIVSPRLLLKIMNLLSYLYDNFLSDSFRVIVFDSFSYFNSGSTGGAPIRGGFLAPDALADVPQVPIVTNSSAAVG
jgi:hypothetical protein